MCFLIFNSHPSSSSLLPEPTPPPSPHSFVHTFLLFNLRRRIYAAHTLVGGSRHLESLKFGDFKNVRGVELEFNPQGFNFLKIPGVGV